MLEQVLELVRVGMREEMAESTERLGNSEAHKYTETFVNSHKPVIIHEENSESNQSLNAYE